MNIRSGLLQQLVVLLRAPQHFGGVLLLYLQLVLLVPQQLDLPVEVVDLLLVYLGLFQHALLERQSLLDQPVVFLLRLLPLFGPDGHLVLLPYLEVVVLLGTAELLLFTLGRGRGTFLVRRTCSLSRCLRSLRAWWMSSRRWLWVCRNYSTSRAFLRPSNSLFWSNSYFIISWIFL